jgi:hypothetical protein
MVPRRSVDSEKTRTTQLLRDRRRYAELVLGLERKFARWEDLAGRAGD